MLEKRLTHPPQGRLVDLQRDGEDFRRGRRGDVLRSEKLPAPLGSLGLWLAPGEREEKRGPSASGS